MSKQKHTPEPWRVFSGENTFIHGIDGQNDEAVIVFLTEDELEEIGNTLSPERQNENIRRIVACVNACAGMDDPATEIEALRARVAELDGMLPKKPEPNWDEAPEWAKYWAVDEDGTSYYIQGRPIQGLRGWFGSDGVWKYTGVVNLQGFDWRKTLTPRPC